jgi:integrase/recombinase XerD
LPGRNDERADYAVAEPVTGLAHAAARRLWTWTLFSTAAFRSRSSPYIESAAVHEVGALVGTRTRTDVLLGTSMTGGCGGPSRHRIRLSAMRFDEAIDVFLDDMQMQGRLNSVDSIQAYCARLEAHVEDAHGRDPAHVEREDVKRTLHRWPNANTRGTNRSILISFYDWMVEEGYRPDNPARQTRRIRRRTPPRPRLTEDEARRMLEAASGARERRVIFLALCAGLRSAELRGLQGRNLQRAGAVWVSADIAKGGRERYVPITVDLVPVVNEIRSHVDPYEYVLPAMRINGPPCSHDPLDCRWHPSSACALKGLVARVAARAGTGIHVTPHTLRHAYAEHIARGTDVRIAQQLLGHATLQTTVRYLSPPRYDDIASAVKHLSYAEAPGTGTASIGE